MSNYTHVQFISWELYTGPFKTAKRPEQGWYAGLFDLNPDKRIGALGQCQDIDARIAFTTDAIAKAEAVSDRRATTLKVFMAPEFLYRGAGGAYLHDLINGWTKQAPAELALPAPYDGPWGGLFGGLRALVAKPAYNDWLFVFGTALSASFPTARHKKPCLLDPTAMGEVYNSALIQRGGGGNAGATHVSCKHYISAIDFVNWSATTMATEHVAHRVAPLDEQSVLPPDVIGGLEPGALFQIAGIKDAGDNPIDFGIEICLDHLASANGTANGMGDVGRIRGAGRQVRIQLVPSGGMQLQPDSISLQSAGGATPHAYAFNCDGRYQLRTGSDGSHTQLWNGSKGDSAPPAGNRLVEASSGERVDHTVLVALKTTVELATCRVDATTLWNNGINQGGAGAVRVLASRDL